MRQIAAIAAGAFFTLLTTGCGAPAAESSATPDFRIDGSSTVYPVSAEAVRRYSRRNREAVINVRFSGTTGGFRRFCQGETEINDASRPINAEEIETCAANGVRFIELPIGFDALSVVVHPDNDWARDITVEELRRLWEPAAEGRVTTWRNVRTGWPDEPIHLFGPGGDSGTYDYFTTAIVGAARRSRHDYTASEDDDVLVEGVAGDPLALGFFGFGYYVRNWEELAVLAVDAGDGPVQPSLETVRDGSYQPLSRPLFLYVNADAVHNRPGLREFVEGSLGGMRTWMPLTGYMPLSETLYVRARERFAQGDTGTRFDGAPAVGLSMDDLL